MSNLAKLDFVALHITGKNYLSWVLDAEIHLEANGLGEAIKEKNTACAQDKAKAMIFLRHHLDEGLKTKYLTVKDPLVLWVSLKERYEHQKTVILPKARYDWMHLQFQDFKSVSEYNSTLFRITSQLKLCGEKTTDSDMLEKTFSTFHASNMLLQQQYREKNFKKYSELISFLLVAEQNNELLIKNHEARPTGYAPLPEVNTIRFNYRGRGRSRGRGNGRGGYGGNFKYTSRHLKWENKEQKAGKDGDAGMKIENSCHRCGCKGHWSLTCRAPKHLVELYQQSLKSKGKAEANYVNDDGGTGVINMEDNIDFGQNDLTHLDVADFLIE